MVYCHKYEILRLRCRQKAAVTFAQEDKPALCAVRRVLKTGYA